MSSNSFELVYILTLKSYTNTKTCMREIVCLFLHLSNLYENKWTKIIKQSVHLKFPSFEFYSNDDLIAYQIKYLHSFIMKTGFYNEVMILY